jgi:hypothetical protein
MLTRETRVAVGYVVVKTRYTLKQTESISSSNENFIDKL